MMFYYKSTHTYEVVCKYEHPNLCNMKLIQDEISILILSSPFFVSSIKYMRARRSPLRHRLCAGQAMPIVYSQEIFVTIMLGTCLPKLELVFGSSSLAIFPL